MKWGEGEGGLRVVYDVVSEGCAEYASLSRVLNATRAGEVAETLQQQGLMPTSREAFTVFALDGRHALLGVQVVSVGTLTTSLVHPREVFRFAIASGAAAVLVMHNHPSGDCAVSRQDLDVTKRLVKAGDLLGIPLVDHVVFGGRGNLYSFKEHGELGA